MKIIVTGGAGFIGTSVVYHLLDTIGATVVNLDKLNYAGAHSPLARLPPSGRYCLERLDICDRRRVEDVFDRHQPDAVMHLAAESHVDPSIDRPDDFIASNLVGTFNLLEVTRKFLSDLPAEGKQRFRFHHISTDEVFASLEASAPHLKRTGRKIGCVKEVAFRQGFIDIDLLLHLAKQYANCLPSVRAALPERS